MSVAMPAYRDCKEAHMESGFWYKLHLQQQIAVSKVIQDSANVSSGPYLFENIECILFR